jgi:hypothetical protein
MTFKRFGLVLFLSTQLACAAVTPGSNGDGGGTGGGGWTGGGGNVQGSGGSGVVPDAAGSGGGPVGGTGGAGSSAPSGPWGGAPTVDPMAPAGAAGRFAGAETMTGGPKIVYPLDGSMHPLNIADVTVQWSGVAAQDGVYRLRFTNTAGTADIITVCRVAECIYPVPVAVWHNMASANADRDVTLTVSAAGSQIRSSAPIRLRFSPANVNGGLYYWSTANQGLFRLTFGQRKAAPYNPGRVDAGSQPRCIGCHSVSRNGKVIAWAGESTVGLAATEGTPATRGVMPRVTEAMAVNPDGSRVLVPGVVVPGVEDLVLADAATGSMIGTVNRALLQNRKALYPEWSPDGKEIVLSLQKAPAGIGPTGLNDSEVAILPYNDGAFGPVRILVPTAGDNNYYPSWSPDGKWIVFSSAPGHTFSNPRARLRLIAASGGKIYELGRATHLPGMTTSWPKFSPFSQAGGQVMFVGFSSVMDYGFLRKRSTAPGGGEAPGPMPGEIPGMGSTGSSSSQLWFAAIDLRRLAEGDPSWAPIWLPFQEVTQSNHIPIWTEVVGCREDADCGPGARCQSVENRPQCIPNPVVVQ